MESRQITTPPPVRAKVVELRSPEAQARDILQAHAEERLSPPSSQRLAVLDGVRGVAILLVMLHHFTPERSAGVLSVLHPGWVGVDLFFVLSGFLITGILYDAKDSPHYFRNFYARRVLRIFPLYYGVLLVILGLLPLLQWMNAIHVPGLDQVRGYQAWLWLHSSNILLSWKGAWVLDSGVIRMNHFWSLAVEEHFYLVWPIVVLMFGRKTLLRICIGIVVGALALRAILCWQQVTYIASYTLTPCRMDALAVGAFLALAHRSPRGLYALRRSAIWVAACAVATLGIIVALTRNFSRTDAPMDTLGFSALALLGGATLIWALTASATSWTKKFWSQPWLRWLGKYSYALYVFHPMVIPLLPAAVGAASLAALLHSALLGSVVSALVAGIISCTAAWLSWHLMEKRMLGLKRFFEYAPTSSALSNRLRPPELAEGNFQLGKRQ